jgi:hypothetical protein
MYTTAPTMIMAAITTTTMMTIDSVVRMIASVLHFGEVATAFPVQQTGQRQHARTPMVVEHHTRELPLDRYLHRLVQTLNGQIDDSRLQIRSGHKLDGVSIG